MKLRKAAFTLGAASAVSTLLFGSTTASADTAAVTDRFANYAAEKCITSVVNGSLHADACTPITRLKQWTWSGVINGTPTVIKNVGTGYCLDSNDSGHVYSLPCSSSRNQRWFVVQPAPRSAILLENLDTGRCLQQNANGLYSTMTCNRNLYIQRWTIG